MTENDRPAIGTEMHYNELPYDVVYKRVCDSDNGFTMVKITSTCPNYYAEQKDGKWKSTCGAMRVDNDEQVKVVGYLDE